MLVKKEKNFLILFFAISIAIPFIIALTNILKGNVTLWYDNARDLLLAWDSLKKPTLIGSTSGIPGIFYGPYSIWLLSIGLIFSKNPISAVITSEFIPYCVIFPFILLLFRKIFNLKTIIIIWVLFIFSTGLSYSTGMWVVHMAPLLFLILIYLLTEFKSEITYIRYVLIGMTAGILINFHISFGIGVYFGVLIFFFLHTLIKILANKKEWVKIIKYSLFGLFFYILGTVVAFTPSIIFESRHGFNQLKTMLFTFSKYGAVVGLKGLSRIDILKMFFGRLGIILHINEFWSYLVEMIMFVSLIVGIKLKKIKFSELEKTLFLVIFSISIGILFIFLTARNPVWNYHFIGTEVIFLLFFALFINKLKFLQNITLIGVVILLISASSSFINDFKKDPYKETSLFTLNYIVDKINTDAKGTFYTVYNYSPSIYTYEYTYLFRWRINKDVPYDPGQIVKDNPLVYLIIPRVSELVIKDFINYRTPNSKYRTVKTWNIPNGTTILKREKIN